MGATPEGRPPAAPPRVDVCTATGAEIRQAGLAAVADALGPAGPARFLALYEGGRGDYTAERDALLGGVSVDDVLGPAAANR